MRIKLSLITTLVLSRRCGSMPAARLPPTASFQSFCSSRGVFGSLLKVFASFCTICHPSPLNRLLEIIRAQLSWLFLISQLIKDFFQKVLLFLLALVVCFKTAVSECRWPTCSFQQWSTINFTSFSLSLVWHSSTAASLIKAQRKWIQFLKDLLNAISYFQTVFSQLFCTNSRN